MSEATITATAPIDQAEQSRQSGLSDGVRLPELHLVRPLAGFGELTRFALVRIDHAGNARHAQSGPDAAPPDGGDDTDADDDPMASLLFELRSVQAPDVRFLVAAPAAFFPDYTVELDEVAVAELGLERAEDALILVILTVGANSASTTANLLAPVVVNARNRSAVQVILSGTDWPVRATVA
jgi:flagellar assembly factor FliW